MNFQKIPILGLLILKKKYKNIEEFDHKKFFEDLCEIDIESRRNYNIYISIQDDPYKWENIKNFLEEITY